MMANVKDSNTTAPAATGNTTREIPQGNDEQQGEVTTTGGGKVEQEEPFFSFCWYICGWILFPLRVLLGSCAFLCGFCLNSSADARKHGEKQETWNDTKEALVTFLEESGISEELEAGWNQRFIRNARLVNAIQRKLYPKGRAHATLMEKENIVTCDTAKAHRIMKFATAAYGPQVIANALFESGEKLPPMPTATIRKAVMTHIGVPDKDENIIVMKLKYGEKLDYLRHFCVLDHKHKAVVFAVRGTYSLSSTIVDLAGYCEEFCGGMAHAGMAKMARGIWEASGADVVKALTEYPEYDFIICGHSLGAGVAGLLNVLVHHENLLPSLRNSTAQCYLYGGPPSFSMLPNAGDDRQRQLLPAVENTKSFIFQRDAVPFISVDSVRRLMRSVAAVDKLKVSLWRVALTDHLILEPTDEILQTYQEAEREELPPVDNAPQLYIPAKAVIWIEIDEQKNACCRREGYKVSCCDPQKVMDVGLSIGPSGIADHLTGRYEYSLQYSNE